LGFEFPLVFMIHGERLRVNGFVDKVISVNLQKVKFLMVISVKIISLKLSPCTVHV